jgi:hypothetical protein
MTINFFIRIFPIFSHADYHIQSKIHEIRGAKVMLDFDLAKLYQVPTKSLNWPLKEIFNDSGQLHVSIDKA